MKLRNLLLCGGLLTAMSASAALNITERTAPVVETMDPAVDGETIQYLYNVGDKSFFLGANDWNTRASVSKEKGYKVKLTSTGDGTTMSIVDSVETQSAWKNVWTDAPNNIWVDYNNQENIDLEGWSYAFVNGSSGYFTISHNGAAPDAFLGVVLGDDTRLYLYPAETENFSYQWASVSETAYSAWASANEVFTAATALYAKLQEADAAGLTGLDEYIAIYNNAASNAEELNNATTAVNEAIAAAAAGSATAENPADLTNKLANPTLDENVSGWSGTGMAHGHKSGEHYNKTYDTYQTVENMPAGVYALGLTGYYRAGNSGPSWDNFKADTGKNALLYAINKKADAANDTLTSPICNIFQGIAANDNTIGGSSISEVKVGEDTYYVPNNMETANMYFEAGHYKDNKVFFEISEGAAQVGVKKETTIGGDWTMLGDFTLKYYGAGADAYALWYSELIKSAPNYSEDDQITVSVLEAYNAVVEEAKKATVTNMAEVIANYAKVEEALEIIKANATAWAEYLLQYEEAQKAAANGDLAGPSMDALNDYLFDAEEIVNAKTLTTDELIAAAEALKNMISEAIQNAIKPGTVYDQLKNTNFADGATHWTHNVTAVNSTAKVAESYDQGSFDMYQTVENAPVGIYAVSVQAFGRAKRDLEAWSLYYDATTGEKLPNVDPVGAYIYMNDNKATLPNVFDYKVPYTEDADGNANHIYVGTDHYVDPNSEYVYPNDIPSAGIAFQENEENYKVETYGLVAKKGDALRIGVKGSTNSPISPTWAIWTNFKLVFWGTEAEYVAPRLKDVIDAIDLSAPMGTDVIEKATALKTAGEAAYAANPQVGKDMFDVLAEILHYNDSITSSVEVFAELGEAINALLEYAPEAPNAAIKDEAVAFANDTKKNMATFTNANAEEAIAKLAEYTTKLSYPADYAQASDNNPIDFTAVLKTPSFEKDGVNSLEGWENTTGYNFGNDDTQKAALALEFYQKNFDMYQTVAVPNGTYMVTVKGFDKDTKVDGQGNYDLWVAGTPMDAVMYAVSGENTSSVNFVNIASDNNASTEAIGGGSYAHDGITYYVPNSMSEFRTFIDNDANCYMNSLYINVVDETLKIGFKSTSGSEWVIMDEVTLTYYGTNSSLGIEGIEYFGTPAKVEYFQLNGVKAASMQKGFNIVRMTDANGNVKIKKVIVK